MWMKSLPLRVCLADQSGAHGKSLVNDEATNNFTLPALWLKPSLWNTNFTTSPSGVPAFHFGVKVRIKSSQGLWFKHSEANIAPCNTSSPLISITNRWPEQWRYYLLLHLLWIMKAHHPSLLAGCQGLLRAGRLRECSYPRCIELKWDPLGTQTVSWLRHADATRQSTHTLTQTCTLKHTSNYTHKINAVKGRGASSEPSWSNYLSGTEAWISLSPCKHSKSFLFQRAAATNHFIW